MSAAWSDDIPDVGAKKAAAPPLPPVVEWMEFAGRAMNPPDTVVSSILHRGSKMVLGGGSKSFKTWTLVDLALSVACGAPWWGFDTKQGKVCYINLEIQEYFFRQRCMDVAQAKEITVKHGNLFVWNLRGHAADLSSIQAQLSEGLKGRDLSLIVVDPIYKVMGARDENNAGDIAGMLNEIEKLAVETGAAVVFGSHFAKGNPASKDSIDRISGSGVFARDPDTILTLTRHQEEDHYVVEPVLRNFPPVKPFVVRWLHPLMERDEGADATELRGAKGGRPKKFDAEGLVSILDVNPMNRKDWMEAARKILGMSDATFKRLAAEARKSGLVEQAGQLFRRATNAQFPFVTKVSDLREAAAANPA